MDKKALVIHRELTDDMVFSGKTLLKNLTRNKIPILAAMWFLHREAEEWKFILVYTDFRENGSADLYRMISAFNRSNISKKYKPIPLNYIHIQSDTGFFYQRMKGAFHVVDGGVRVSNSMINGMDLYDCFIYRFI